MMPFLDTCIYCGQEYHPMMRWSKSEEVITICYRTKCERAAKKAGYSRRPDLTPNR